MITFFTAPKAMEGDAARLQRNAIGSWRQLAGVQVVLVGDDAGVQELAAELGADHVAGVAANEHGTPRLDSTFAAARSVARHRLLCFANADIVMREDLLSAARTLGDRFPSFLAVGESWDAPLEEALDFAAAWEGVVAEALSGARRRGAGALDFFLFTDDLFRELPPFAIGRIGFDNWLVWRAHDEGAAVVDVTGAVRPLHQRHGYGHLRGGRDATRHESPEGRRNLELAGAAGGQVFTRYDATHLLTRRGVRRNLLRPFRLKERARKAVYRVRLLTPWPPRT